MSFLKTNGHWVGLLGVALASFAGSYFLKQAEEDLPDALKKLQPAPLKSKEVPSLDLSSLKTASDWISKPSLWKTDYASLLFVSEHYLLEDGQPKRPKEGSIHAHSKTRQPIPNSWFIQNKLPLFSARIPLEDTDGDGFSNEEEWLAGTDPNDPKSHPPLVGKLEFTSQKVINNRVRFLQYLGNPAKPENLKITVRAEDIAAATQVELKVGGTIPGTNFVLKSFESRKVKVANSSVPLDASVIFIEEKTTGRVEHAEIQQFANFTDRTIYFRLNYSKLEKEFSGKPGDKIALDEGESYELIDASATSARLRSATGTEIEVKLAQP